MIHLYSLNDLKNYGIHTLTGEADRYSFRILCDLSQQGVDLICEFFGMQAGGFAENWNSTVGNEPAVASIMLTRDTLWEIARFALLHVEQCDVVTENGQALCGLVKGESHFDQHLEWFNLQGARVYRNYGKTSSAPGIGSRNTHAMSGRTV